MKLLIKAGLFFLLLLISLVGYSQQQIDESFTLEECIEYALKNSMSLQNARIDETIAKARVGETRGIGLPQVNAEVSYINNFAIQTVFLPAVFFAEDPNTVPADAAPVPVRFGVKQTGQLGLSVRQLIFDGSYIVGLQAANTYQELSQKNTKRSQIETKVAVSKAYYSVLVSRERLELLKSNVSRLDTLLKETKALYETGLAEKIDVDRIQVNNNNMNVQLNNTERLLLLNAALLKFQMGMNVTDTITIEGSLDQVDFSEEMIEIPDFKYSDRIEYSLLQTQRELSILNLKNYKASSLPKLNGFVGVGYNSGTDKFSDLTEASNWFGYGNWGLTLSLPIFSGLQRHYQVQQAKLSVMKEENNLNNLQNSIELEIDQAKTILQNALQVLATQKESMQLAEEVYQVSNIKYKEGVGSNLEIINAETSYKEAQTNYYSALYDALNAKVDLQKALGTLK